MAANRSRVAAILLAVLLTGAVAAGIFSFLVLPQPPLANSPRRPAVAQDPLAEGLVGHYRFNEGQGTRVGDVSPSGNHGTAVGGVSWTAGPKAGSKALSFDGKTGYVKCDKDLNRWLGGTATVTLWIKTKQVGSKDGFQPVVSVIGVDAGSNSHEDVAWGFLDDSGRIGVLAGDPGYPKEKNLDQMYARSARPINDGQWHHVALTRDATLGRLQVYVDGTLSASTVTGARGNRTTPFSSIGRKELAGSAIYFQGLLADVRLYQRVLTAAEIGDLAK
jgi:hypothetical protein